MGRDYTLSGQGPSVATCTEFLGILFHSKVLSISIMGWAIQACACLSGGVNMMVPFQKPFRAPSSIRPLRLGYPKGSQV